MLLSYVHTVEYQYISLLHFTLTYSVLYILKNLVIIIFVHNCGHITLSGIWCLCMFICHNFMQIIFNSL